MIDVDISIVAGLDPAIFTPSRATEGSAGYDLKVTSDVVVPERGRGFVQVGSGVCMKIQEGYVGLVFPRSSMDAKTNSTLTNCVGVIDSDYIGEIGFRLKAGSMNIQGGSFIPAETPICQIVFVKAEDAKFTVKEQLVLTARGTGGFGSSDKLKK